MSSISIQQAQQLFENGHISSDLYEKIIGNTSDQDRDEALKAAGKEDVINNMIPKRETGEGSSVPDAPIPTTPDMEKYRTWGVPAQEETQKGPAINFGFEDPEPGSPVTNGGDPHDPLNGNIPEAPQPVYNGPNIPSLARNNEAQYGEQAPLTGFQRGYISKDGVPPVPENETPKAPIMDAKNPASPIYVNPASPYANNTPAEQAVVNAGNNVTPTAPASPGGAVVGKTAPVNPDAPKQYVVKKTIVGYGNDGPIYEDRRVEVDPNPVFQRPAFGGTPEGNKAYQEQQEAKRQAEQEKADREAGRAPQGSLPTDSQPAPRAPVSGGGGGVAAPPPLDWGPLESAYGEQKAGLKTGAAADVAESDLVSKHMQNQQYDLMARAREEQAKQAQEQAVMKDRIDAIDRKNTELSQQKLDPKRLYNSASTGEKILGGLAMLLGAAGAANPNSHGENKAVSIIQNAIDRDLQAQKVDIETGFTGTKARAGLLRDYLDVTKDRHLAYESAKLDYLNRAKMQLETIGAKFKGAQALAKYQVAIGQLDERLAEQKMKLAGANRGAGAGGAPKGESDDLKYVSKENLDHNIPSLTAALDAGDRINADDTVGLVAKDILDTSGHIPVIGAIVKKAYGAAEPTAARNEQTLQFINQGVRQSLTGKGFSQEEARGYADSLFSDRTPEGIHHGLSLARTMVNATKAEILAGVENRPEKGVTERGRTARQEVQVRHGEENAVTNAEKRKKDGPGQPGPAK